MKQYRAQAARVLKKPYSRKSLCLSIRLALRPHTDGKPSLMLDKERNLEIWTDWANHPSSGSPRRRFKIALTACGFALPCVAFIT